MWWQTPRLQPRKTEGEQATKANKPTRSPCHEWCSNALGKWCSCQVLQHVSGVTNPSRRTSIRNTEMMWCLAYLSGTSVLCQHGAFSHFFRLFSTFGVMHQNVVTLGGVCVCFSKSVGKRRFRNVWVGGGRWSQFCAQSCTREDTQGTGNGPGITHYSESDSLSSLPLSARAGTPLGHTSPCL